MLKLMKYEFIHSYRTFLAAFVVFLVGCVMMPYAMNGFLGNIPFITIIFGMGFMFLVIGITLALFIGIFINYDRSMFKRPGYLTLTLPATTTQIILSKILTTIVWLIVAMFVLLCGFTLMGVIISIRENSFSLGDIFQGMELLRNGFVEYLLTQPINFFGDVLFVIGELLTAVGSIYFSLTVVHTKWFRKHQWLFGIVIYFIVSLFIGWMSSLIFIDNPTISIGQTYLFSLMRGVYYLIVGVLLSAGTIYCIDHYIEIE